jgi:hypothetical protein
MSISYSCWDEYAAFSVTAILEFRLSDRDDLLIVVLFIPVILWFEEAMNRVVKNGINGINGINGMGYNFPYYQVEHKDSHHCKHDWFQYIVVVVVVVVLVVNKQNEEQMAVVVADTVQMVVVVADTAQMAVVAVKIYSVSPGTLLMVMVVGVVVEISMEHYHMSFGSRLPQKQNRQHRGEVVLIIAMILTIELDIR